MTIDHTRPSTDVLLYEGGFFILDDFALREEMYARVVDAFLRGIEALEGPTCRARVEEAGLARVHEHFPAEKVLLLEDHLHRHLARDLYDWSYRVGRDDLGIANEFFVDNLIMFRVHYPFLVAREAKNVVSPPFPFREKLRAGLADLRSAHMIGNRLNDFRKKTLAGWLGLRDPRTTYDAGAYYHHGLPSPARAHGPHVDTWYGHSYDGINLWWSIDGVNEDNTVILYPELFGHPVAYDPRSMYLAAGVPLPKPRKVALKPGQLLLFNPEILHGTQVNISDETRFAITTRINPKTPRFNPRADFHFQHWHSSEDLARKRFAKLRVFPKTKYRGEPSVPEKTEPWVQRVLRVRSSERLGRGAAVPVCASEDLRVGEKMAVDLRNAKLLIHRGERGLHAVSRICAHVGLDLIDGHHEGDRIFCPGHGVEYSLADGHSKCPAFRLRRYVATDRDGRIWVEMESSADDSREPAESPAAT